MVGGTLAAAEALARAELVDVATWAVATVVVALDSAGAREGEQAEASSATKNAHCGRGQRRRGRKSTWGSSGFPKTLPELAGGSNRPLVPVPTARFAAVNFMLQGSGTDDYRRGAL